MYTYSMYLLHCNNLKAPVVRHHRRPPCWAICAAGLPPAPPWGTGPGDMTSLWIEPSAP